MIPRTVTAFRRRTGRARNLLLCMPARLRTVNRCPVV